MFKTLRYINWSELSGLLTGALLAVAICVAMFILVAKLQQEGILGRKEYSLYCDLVSSQGLHKGTIVQINGVDIGSIDRISLTENGLVRLKLILDAQYKHWITDKSTVYATRDQNIISERVLTIDISQKGNKILEDEEFLIAGTAQDIETVLKTANELIDKISKLVIAADTLLNLVLDTNTSIGAVLGSRVLYNNLDHAVIRLDNMLGDAGGLIAGLNGIFKTVNDGMPHATAFVDTVSTSVIGLMGNLDNLTYRAHGLINSLDTTMQNVSGMVSSLNSMMSDGSQMLNKTDDFMTGISKFWFMRSKIPQRDSIPLLGESKW